MASGWKPLVLSPVDHPKHDPKKSLLPKRRNSAGEATLAGSSQPITSISDVHLNREPNHQTASSSVQIARVVDVGPSLEHTHNVSPERTPFDQPLPARLPSRYLDDAKPGRRYALYTLVPLSHRSAADLIDSIVSNAAAEDWWSTVVLAPTHNFSGGNNNSLRDIYDYHTSLLEVVQSNPHNLHPSRFLVAAHQNWAANGILLVDLNCKPDVPGTIGVMRLTTGMTGSCMMLLDHDHRYWVDLKVAETQQEWLNPIPGYSGSTLAALSPEWSEHIKY